MSIFSYNFLDRSRKQDLASYSENFSKNGYNWEDIKRQMSGFSMEKPPDPPKPEEKPAIPRENSWGFFNNPQSEWEEKHKSMVAEYKKEMQARFQEKIERDKQPRYHQKLQNFTSATYQEKPIEEPRSFMSYNKSYVSNVNESFVPKERVEYYSPQVVSKYNKVDPPQTRLVQKSPEPSFEYSRANITSDQNKILRDRQKEEWLKAVQQQVEERNKIKEEQKSKKMLDDKLEEAKIKRDIDELNRRHKQEIRYETGLPVEENYEPPPRRLPPKIEEREVPAVRQVAVVPNKPKENYKVKHEVALQEAGIRDIIMKIKSEASHAAAERQELLNDFERYKAELRNSRIYDPFTNPAAYYKPYRPENKVIPLTQAGRSIISGSWGKGDELKSNSQYLANKPVKNQYQNIEDIEAKNRLNRLDEIIMAEASERESDEKELDRAIVASEEQSDRKEVSGNEEVEQGEFRIFKTENIEESAESVKIPQEDDNKSLKNED